MPKNLVIVESPAKARTIEKYLGSEFIVKASMGHIRDLPKDDTAIDVDSGFEPTYVVSEGKEKVVAELRKLSKEAETVWLATDEDREGEAIAWHLHEELKLAKKNTQRIVYHEITKPAILKAISNPRSINYDLVDAQQARRVLDRLVGFELSPLLWKKVKPSLSAGRVQSVATRLIVEREREIRAFESSPAFRITGVFANTAGETKSFVAELPERFSESLQAESFLNACIGAEYYVRNLEVKPKKKSPPPPFTTSTLQQEASRKIGLSIAQTMQVAQKLYEEGYITYMRTDSVSLSETAMEMAQTEIVNQFGAHYYRARKYANKNESAQEAHEAIRPTAFDRDSINGSHVEKRLYNLIWKQTMASQMQDANIERTIVTISISPSNISISPSKNIEKASSLRPDYFVAEGEVIKFDGFLCLYRDTQEEESEAEENSSMLPPLTIGESIDCFEINAVERYSKPPARYTEAALVKKLEELGIGRPSTYAPTISTIQKRDYVLKEDRPAQIRKIQMFVLKENAVSHEWREEKFGAEKNKLFPTDIGGVVTDFLLQYFQHIMDYSFTANVEMQFDEIAEGKKNWRQMLKEFYQPFHSSIAEIMQADIKRGAERLLGEDSSTKQPVYAKLGRYGPMIQIGESNSGDTRFASIPADLSLETITLEEAMRLFQLPRTVGQFENEEIIVAIGKYGPYIRHKGKFYSLMDNDDPMTISESRAQDLIVGKRINDAKMVIKSFPENTEVRVLNGRYGPYISIGKSNIKIPYGKKPEDLTLQECIELQQKQASEKSGSHRFKKQTPDSNGSSEKKTSKKSTGKSPKKSPSKRGAGRTV